MLYTRAFILYVIYSNLSLLLPHHHLQHLYPPGPHFLDKLKDVVVIFPLQSLHHCIKSDESANTTPALEDREMDQLK